MMVVVGLDMLRSDHYEYESGQKVANVNPDYPRDDDVVEVVYVKCTDIDIDKKRYAYPRSRLERVASVHDKEVSE